VPRLRGAAFAALAATHLVGLARGADGGDAAFLLALIFAIDPGWFGAGRPAPTAAADLVLYDGDCGLCHRAVRFLIAEDREGIRFRFAPLGGAEATRRLGAAIAAGPLPDSIVYLPGDLPGRTLVRSAAVLAALDRLGGLWRAIAIAGRLVPRSIGDALYDAVARVRRRIFAAPGAACPLIPPALRGRFSLDPPGAAAAGEPRPTDSRPGGTAFPGSPGGSPPPSA
jgi:predicted DCC family thiol-disulfide oxidoreductase YuxK